MLFKPNENDHEEETGSDSLHGKFSSKPNG
jgi:hypothetical protein